MKKLFFIIIIFLSYTQPSHASTYYPLVYNNILTVFNQVTQRTSQIQSFINAVHENTNSDIIVHAAHLTFATILESASMLAHIRKLHEDGTEVLDANDVLLLSEAMLSYIQASKSFLIYEDNICKGIWKKTETTEINTTAIPNLTEANLKLLKIINKRDSSINSSQYGIHPHGYHPSLSKIISTTRTKTEKILVKFQPLISTFPRTTDINSVIGPTIAFSESLNILELFLYDVWEDILKNSVSLGGLPSLGSKYVKNKIIMDSLFNAITAYRKAHTILLAYENSILYDHRNQSEISELDDALTKISEGNSQLNRALENFSSQ